MLRDDELEIQIGRGQAANGKFGSYLRVIHRPTGIKRLQAPFGEMNAREIERRLRAEIETELKTKGLTHYIIS